MARRSPLFVGALIAVAVAVSADVAFMVRAGHHARTPAAPPPEDPVPVDVSPPSPAPPPPRTTARSPAARAPTGALGPPPPAAPPAPAPEPAPQPLRVAGQQLVDAAAPRDPELTGSAQQWRTLAIADRNLRVIKEADEKTFEGLSLPEDKRAAIRRIDEDYLRRKQELQLASEQAGPAAAAPQAITGASDGQPDRERRAALEQLLGEDGARRFHEAENTNALQVRPENGRPWFHPSQH